MSAQEEEFGPEDYDFIEGIADRYIRMKCVEMALNINRHQTQNQMVARAKGIYRAVTQDTDWAAPEDH